MALGFLHSVKTYQQILSLPFLEHYRQTDDNETRTSPSLSVVQLGLVGHSLPELLHHLDAAGYVAVDIAAGGVAAGAQGFIGLPAAVAFAALVDSGGPVAAVADYIAVDIAAGGVAAGAQGFVGLPAAVAFAALVDSGGPVAAVADYIAVDIAAGGVAAGAQGFVGLPAAVAFAALVDSGGPVAAVADFVPAFPDSAAPAVVSVAVSAAPVFAVASAVPVVAFAGGFVQAAVALALGVC